MSIKRARWRLLSESGVDSAVFWTAGSNVEQVIWPNLTLVVIGILVWRQIRPPKSGSKNGLCGWCDAVGLTNATLTAKMCSEETKCDVFRSKSLKFDWWYPELSDNDDIDPNSLGNNSILEGPFLWLKQIAGKVHSLKSAASYDNKAPLHAACRALQRGLIFLFTMCDNLFCHFKLRWPPQDVSCGRRFKWQLC